MPTWPSQSSPSAGSLLDGVLDAEHEARRIGELLQLDLPQPHARSIRAAAVAKKAAFEKIESWKRRDELSKESTTLPSGSYQSSELVEACSAEILKPQVAAVR